MVAGINKLMVRMSMFRLGDRNWSPSNRAVSDMQYLEAFVFEKWVLHCGGSNDVMVWQGHPPSQKLSVAWAV